METRDLDQDTLLDVDRDGNICRITIEHAKSGADIPKFSYEYTAAWTMLRPAQKPESEEEWLRAASSSEAFRFLSDPAEDLYTPGDGEPFQDAK